MRGRRHVSACLARSFPHRIHEEHKNETKSVAEYSLYSRYSKLDAIAIGRMPDRQNGMAEAKQGVLILLREIYY